MQSNGSSDGMVFAAIKRTTMEADIITGTWMTKNKLPYATWRANDSGAKGFAVVNVKSNQGKLYIDSNNSGARDRGDKVIANLTKTKEEVTPYDASHGTWSLDTSTNKGVFYNRDGVELIAAVYTNVSYF